MNEIIRLLNDIANDDFKNADGVLLTNDARWHALGQLLEQKRLDNVDDIVTDTIAAQSGTLARFAC